MRIGDMKRCDTKQVLVRQALNSWQPHRRGEVLQGPGAVADVEVTEPLKIYRRETLNVSDSSNGEDA